jgi:hypothetical protein
MLSSAIAATPIGPIGPDPGGFLFESKAICPDCAPRWRRNAAEFNEERFIRGECPPSQSFADWVRELRGPNAAITVSYRSPQ